MTGPTALLRDLRQNLATWAADASVLPAVAEAMLRALPAEEFDPAFRGQDLETTYLDTRGFDLRKARRRGKKYLTLRIRCYRPANSARQIRQEVYALSAKTETEKVRVEVPADLAEAILDRTAPIGRLLPASLRARLYDLAGEEEPLPVVTVCCRRYAREDETDRLTLDVGVRTDSGKSLPTAVLEFKSTTGNAAAPPSVAVLGLRPMKLSKFLWSTLWR